MTLNKQNAKQSLHTARLNGFWGKIASCNVHALKNTQLNHFKEVFKSHNIVCLQETHGKPSSIKMMIKRLGFKNGLFSIIQKQARGSAVLWRDGNKIAEETDNQGRIAGVALEFNDCKLTVKKLGPLPFIDTDTHHKILTTFPLIPGWFFFVRLFLDFALSGIQTNSNISLCSKC